MAIRIIEEDVPSKFPPARLFLDDIEEIARILQDAVQKQQIEGHSRVEDLKLKVTFSVAGQECDDPQDLPRITKSNRQLSIEVSGGSGVGSSLIFYPWFGTIWQSYGLTKQDAWTVFHKLQPLFKKRNLRWRTLNHSFPWWFHMIFVGATLYLVPFLRSSLYKLMPHPAVDGTLVLLLGTLFTALITGSRHTTLTLRHSWDPSPFRQYVKDKLIPVIAGALLGIFGTLLGVYLQHKYWP